MKEDRINCRIASLFYLFECYSNNAQEVKEKVDKYIEDFSEEEKNHFWYRYRTEGYAPFTKPKYLGGNLTDKQKEICERIKKENDVDFL